MSNESKYAIEFRLLRRNCDKSFTELTKEYSGVLHGLKTEEDAKQFLRAISELLDTKRKAAVQP